MLAPGGRLLIVDFAPHDLEFLREEHAHDRLGFAPAQVAHWMKDAGLEPTAATRSGAAAGAGPQAADRFAVARRAAAGGATQDKPARTRALQEAP